MSRIGVSTTLSLLLLLIAVPTAFAEGGFTPGDAKNGEAKFQLCMGCHGPKASGNQAIGSTRLAGRNPEYILRQIRNFKGGVRGANPKDIYGIQMPPIVATLTTDKDIMDVITYIGTLKADILPKTVTGGDAAKGKEIYKLCSACHGDDGKGIKELSSPRIAGVPDWYLKRQIQNFRTGIRGKHEKDIFGRQMSTLQAVIIKDDQAVLDVISYINTLPGD